MTWCLECKQRATMNRHHELCPRCMVVAEMAVDDLIDVLSQCECGCVPS